MAPAPRKTPQQVAEELRKGNAAAANTPVTPAPAPITWNKLPANDGKNGAYAKVTTPASPQSSPTSPATMQKPTTPTVQVKFGASASPLSVADPDYYRKRNDYLGNDFLTKGITTSDSIFKELQKDQDFAKAAQEDQQNTVQEILKRIQKGQSVDGSVEDSIELTPEEKMIKNMKQELGVADLAGESEIAGFVRKSFANQKTIDKETAKFANWNEVNGEVQGVVDAVTRNKMVNASKGLNPTSELDESDIQAAMNATGLSRERIMQIANGQGYDTLEWSDEEKANQTRAFDRSVEDAEIQKQRDLEDLDVRTQTTLENLNNQIEDVVKQVNDGVAQAEKVGALKGFSKSSAYVDGIQAMKDQGNELIGRLRNQAATIRNADAVSRGRIIADFDRNLARAKFDVDKALSDLKSLTAVEIGNMQQDYTSGSPAMDVAIDNLFKKLDLTKADILLKYQQSIGNTIKNAKDQLDLVTAQENKRINQIDKVSSVMNANNGAMLLSMSTKTLNDYVAQGMPKEQAVMWRDAMVNKATNSLIGLSQQDRAEVANLIDQGNTPQQAINAMVAKGYKLAGADGLKIQTIKVRDPNTGDMVDVSVAVDAQGNISNLNTDGLIPNNSSSSSSSTPTQSAAPVPEEKVTQALSTFSTKYPDNSKGGQCGSFANDYLESMGIPRLFVDPINTKKAYINSSNAKVGSVVVLDYGINNTKFSDGTTGNAGHVSIVTKVNADGTIEVKDSNYDYKSNPETVKTHTLSKAEMAKVQGYFDPTLGVKGGADADIENLIKSNKDYELANNILNGVGDLPAKTSKNYERVINAMGKISDYRASQTDDTNLQTLQKSAKYEKVIDATAVKEIKDAKTVIGGINTLTKNLDSIKDDMWPIEGLLRSKNPYDVDAAAVAAQVNALAPKVARGVFGEVGVLTDQDIARYMKTIPNNKMTSNVAQVVGDLLKIGVYKSFINTVVTWAQSGRNTSNFIEDYNKSKEALAKYGVSPYAFDETPAETAPATTTTTTTSTIQIKPWKGRWQK